MCGIAGLIHPGLKAGDLEPIIESMCSKMVHRGPDDEGYHVTDGVALGMRRLSIIDVEGGHQPIISEDGRLCVIFNGEIYNFVPLRAELEEKGHRFRSRTDTEVILHLFEEEGCDCFKRLRGQFAIALYDMHSRELVLARDHLGIKPFFYAQVKDRLCFASELKVLEPLGALGDLNPAAVAQFMALRYVIAPDTIYSGIRKLEPGHYLRWRDARLEKRAFWRLEFPASALDLSDGEFRERTEALLRESVTLRLQADVPLGAFLSGGLDSSVVVALMSERSERVHSFSVGFKRKGYNEFKFSRKVARALSAHHLEHTVGTDQFLEICHTFQQYTDEPIGDPAFIPLFALAEHAAREVTVVLSGEGADEIFGGYPRYSSMLERALSENAGGMAGEGKPNQAKPDGVGSSRREGSDDATRHLGDSEEQTFNAYLNACSYFMDGDPEDILHPDQAKEQPPLRKRLFDVFAKTAKTTHLNRFLWFDLLTWIPDNLLVKADRMGMAHSLEVRVPFLDVRLVEHMAALPERMKIRRETRRRLFKEEPFWNVKALLKEIARDRVPDEVIDREKMGFPVPVRRFLKGALRSFAEDALRTGGLAESGLFAPAYIERVIHRFIKRGKSSWPLWTLFCFELWRRSVWERDKGVMVDIHA